MHTQEHANISINALSRIDSEPVTPGNEVSEVAEPEAVLVPDTTDEASRRKKRRNLFREKLASKGLDAATIDELAVAREVTGSGQRKHPTWATPCSLEMVAFFEGRANEELQAARAKACRLDGGPLGAEKRFEQIISSHPAEEAARQIAGLSRERMRSVRIYCISVDNELRRRDAVARGVDPKTIKYIAIDAS